MDGLTRLIIAIVVFGGVLFLMFRVGDDSSQSGSTGPIGPNDVDTLKDAGGS